MEEIEKPQGALLAPPSLLTNVPSIITSGPSNDIAGSKINLNQNTSIQCCQSSGDSSQLLTQSVETDPHLKPTTSQRHKHVSMRYNMEFSSQVTLISRSYSMGQKQLGIESIPRPALFAKIINFLHSIVDNPNISQKLVDSFKILEKEMKLTVRRSRTSIASSTCSQKLSFGSIKSSQKCKNDSIQNSSGSSNSLKENVAMPGILSRGKSLGMSKFNRISIADAININKVEILKEIDPIKSTESLETESINRIKSRHDLTSQPSETRQSDEDLPAISLELRKNNSKNVKKISIMMMEDFQSGNSLFSEEQVINLSELQLPKLTISQSLITSFFDTSSPFLINLAFCLLFKCLSKGTIHLDQDNLGWLLGISTAIAYKVYYDETVQGLMEFFAGQLKKSMGELAKLERWFLSTVNYELAVSSHQYQNMMIELLSVSGSTAPDQFQK